MALGWKVLGSGGAVIAGIAARKVLDGGWKLSTGHAPPENPEHPDTTWPEALAWALVSGAVIGAARMLATRKAAAYYRRSTGRLPATLR